MEQVSDEIGLRRNRKKKEQEIEEMDVRRAGNKGYGESEGTHIKRNSDFEVHHSGEMGTN